MVPELELAIQRATSPELSPVDDTLVEWTSPFETVAEIALRREAGYEAVDFYLMRKSLEPSQQARWVLSSFTIQVSPMDII